MQCVEGSDVDRERVHRPLFGRLCHLEKIHAAEYGVQPFAAVCKTLVCQLTSKTIAMQHPPALDLNELAGVGTQFLERMVRAEE